MADKISVSIGLEGGDQVEKQLADIGKAGETAFNKIDQAAGKTSFDKVASEIDKTGKALDNAAESANKAGDNAAKAGDGFGKAGDGAAKGTEDISKFSEALNKAASLASTSGATLGDAANSVGKIAPVVTSAASSLDQLVTKLNQAATESAKLGDAGKTVSGGLTTVADGVKTVSTGMTQVSTSIQGATTALTQISTGFKSLSGEFSKLSGAASSTFSTLGNIGTVSGTLASRVSTAASSIGTLGVALLAFGGPVGAIIAGIGALVALGAPVVSMISDWVSESKAAEAALKALSTATGQSVDALKQQQKAFVESGGSAKDFVDVLGKAVAASKNFASDARTSADAQKSAVDQALLAEQKMLKAQLQVEALGGARAPFGAESRIESIEQQVKGITDLEKAQKQAAKAASEFAAAQEAGLKATANNLDTVTQKFRELAAGAKEVKFDDKTLDETKIRAFQQALAETAKRGGDAATAFNRMKGELAGIDISKLKAAGFTDAQIQKIQEGTTEVGGFTKAFLDADTRVREAVGSILQTLGQLASYRVDWDGLVVALQPTIATVNGLINNWVTTPVGNAWQWIVDTFNNAVGGVNTKIEEAKAWINDFVTTPVENAWQWIVEKWNAMLAALGLKGGGQTSGIPPDTSGGGHASGGLIGGRGTATSDSNLAWVSRGEFIINAAAVRHFGASFFAALNARRMPAGASSHGGRYAAGGPIGDFSDLLSQLDGDLTNLYALIDVIRNLPLDATMEQLQRAVDVLTQSFGHARGGLLGGRGTGTSDSNLAWVSRGEHIMPARVVAQPGVLALLEALRRGVDWRDLLAGMGHFARGGPVGLPVFAGGGMGGMHPVTIQFPGLNPISGLRASASVVDELQRAAAMAQVRSGGRKPSRYT